MHNGEKGFTNMSYQIETKNDTLEDSLSVQKAVRLHVVAGKCTVCSDLYR